MGVRIGACAGNDTTKNCSDLASLGAHRGAAFRTGIAPQKRRQRLFAAVSLAVVDCGHFMGGIFVAAMLVRCRSPSQG
jgi:hypothetical protein